MNSEDDSLQELGKTVKGKVDAKRMKINKIVPYDKSGLEKHTIEPIEESKESNSHLFMISDRESQIFISDNEKGSLREESKDGQNKRKKQSQGTEEFSIIREQVNQITFFEFFSKHEAKVRRLINHLILIINFLVLITQGYKDDHPLFVSTPYYVKLPIFFRTCMLLLS
jgi:hypothetical protein